MIEFVGVSKNFGGVAAVRDASLTLSAGELVAVLGPSGCGKTTLLRIAGGYVIADSGSVLIDGREVTRTPPEHRNVGMVFQSYALFPHMSVLDNVAFGLRMRGLSKAERDQRAAAILSLV